MKTLEEIEEPIVSRWVHEPQSRQEVVSEIDDWISRLNQLYAKLENWCESIDGTEIEHGSIVQVIEYPMKKFRVAPREVPELTIWSRNREGKVRFIPDVVWIVGANGRINVDTTTPYHMLVDLGGRGKPSDWQFPTYSERKPMLPFDRAMLLKLLRGSR